MKLRIEVLETLTPEDIAKHQKSFEIGWYQPVEGIPPGVHQLSYLIIPSGYQVGDVIEYELKFHIQT